MIAPAACLDRAESPSDRPGPAPTLHVPPLPGERLRDFLPRVAPLLWPDGPTFADQAAFAEVTVRSADEFAAEIGAADAAGVAVSRIDEAFCSAFSDWLAERFSAITRQRRVSLLRRLLRTAAPERWPKLSAGPHAPGDEAAAPGTLRAFWLQEYLPLRPDLSRGYGEQVRAALNNFRRFLGDREATLRDLTDRTVAGLSAWMLQAGRTPQTVNGQVGVILALWRAAYQEHLIDEPPRLRPLRRLRREPDAWTATELSEVFRSAAAEPGRLLWWSAADWWSALLRVGFYTALRRRSLLALRLADVDLETGWIEARPEVMKNRQGKRLRLGPDAVAAVRRIWAPADRELLFPVPWRDRRVVDRRFAAILDRVGLLDRRRRKSMGLFHKLRRTAATLVASKAGVSAASSLLGHEGHYVTKRYIDPRQMPGADMTAYLAPAAATFAPVVVEAGGAVETVEATPVARPPRSYASADHVAMLAARGAWIHRRRLETAGRLRWVDLLAEYAQLAPRRGWPPLAVPKSLASALRDYCRREGLPFPASPSCAAKESR